MIKRLVVIAILCIETLCAMAQSVLFKTLDREQYLSRVKLVDEFMARFNGDEKRSDIKNSDNETNILLLFDLAKYKSKTDSGFIAAKEFASHVVENNVKLNYEDKDWYAKVKCHCRLGQKKFVCDMYLRFEERDSGIYRWAISNVDGDIFKTSRDMPHDELFIMPNDNEQFFQSIKKTTTETYKYIDDYVKKGYKADALSTFLAIVRFNQLKIESVTDVSFVFLQVPDYIFTIKYFGRETKNAGWLIDECRHLTADEKNKIINTIH